jgi:hypothetical protein
MRAEDSPARSAPQGASPRRGHPLKRLHSMIDYTNKDPSENATYSGIPLGALRHLATIEALNALSAVAAHLTSAPTALIAQRDPLRGTIRVRGRFGTLVNEVDMSFVLPDLNPDRQPIIIATDVRRDPRFSGHPLLELMPHMKSLIALLVPGCPMESRAVLKVVNPAKAALTDGRTVQMLSDICFAAANLLKLERELALCGGEGGRNLHGGHGAGHLHEDGARYGEGEMAAAFLVDTLVKRRHLHSRNAIDYVTLRSWRAALKKHQIAALSTLKQSPPARFLATVADEIAANVRRAYGEGGIRSVVPVPPGSSGGASTLSIELARAVADRLNASLHEALATTGTTERGASSPRKSSRLPTYHLIEPVPGPILVIDDVASSGRHLELAVDACRAQSSAVYAVAWIGK